MKKKIIISFALMAALTLSVAALMIGCGTDAGNKPPQTEQTTTAETLGVAYPTLMTYEEYKKLSPQLQQAYYETFPTPELYMEWFNAVVLAYNETAGNEAEPDDDNVGEITQPTEANKPSNSSSATTNTQNVPVQIVTDPTESDNSTSGTQINKPTEEMPKETQPATVPDILTGYGGVSIGGERD